MITTVAPAKINWTLEVLGRRNDGYHEIRTVMQAIDLHDELSLESLASPALTIRGSGIARDDDLIFRAARAFPATAARSATLRVKKNIPVGAGLGGGSSDAGATLRLLNHASQARVGENKLRSIAATIGSDVAFFLDGGVAVAQGRGEQITQLPDPHPAWLVLVVPPLSVPDKTRLMYRALQDRHYTDGSATEAMARHLGAGGAAPGDLFVNAFEVVSNEVFAGLDKYREWMIEAGAERVHLSGAGPSLFALANGEAEARAIRARMNRPKMGERVYVARTISAAESTLIWDS
ncbi:MAG: 4-(cytidine 5'-diphospho)-2-C-methyl-D-erythritol kinase [Dehalococcoidia bacterium]